LESANAAPLRLAVARIGYRVPRNQFDGTIRAVFSRACYVDCGNSVLVVASNRVADGPTTIVLGPEAGADLRKIFNAGDVLRCRGGRVEARRATFELAHARTWRPRKPRSLLSPRDSAARIAAARARIVAARRTRSSVLDRGGGAAIVDIERACRQLDIADALLCIERFVGWGEGLTPAGDDYLVGLCAGLGALAKGNAARLAFLAKVRDFIASQCGRTTPISAHWLVLASRGHFNESVLGAVDALRANRDPNAAHAAFERLMAVGATSGADAFAGILSGFAAWTKSPMHQSARSERKPRR
jgi:uncharacterized protein DUF2877